MEPGSPQLAVSRPQPKRWSRTSVMAIGLMLLFQLPLPGYLSPGASLANQAGREAVFWALTALLLGYILRIERRPLASVGWRRPSWTSLALGGVGAAVMVGGIVFIYLAVYPALGLSSNEEALAAVQALPSWFRILLIVRAAVFEELFYRGFVIERLSAISGSRWLAATLSCLAFTLAHLDRWGWAHLIVAGFGGVILTALYMARRDLACNMVAHLATDAIGFFAG